MVLAEHCPGLTSVDLWGCDNLTDAEVVALEGHRPGFTSVDLGKCGKLTDAAVMALAKHYPGSTSVDLGEMRKPDGRGCPLPRLHLSEPSELLGPD